MHDASLVAREFVHALGTKAIWIVVSLTAILICGCKVGPNYHRPKVEIPTAFRGPAKGEQAEAQASSFADLPWWKVFQDPQLQELVRTALKQN